MPDLARVLSPYRNSIGAIHRGCILLHWSTQGERTSFAVVRTRTICIIGSTHQIKHLMAPRIASVWMLWLSGYVARADEEPATCQLQVF